VLLKEIKLMLSAPAGRHAVVIGGSIAGLLAGRVLADAFERVTIIERDRFPETSGARKGVPQARHVHVLLRRGQTILERLFPGIEAELIAAGVPQVDWIADSKALGTRGWLPRFETNLKGVSPSRDLLEWSIRQRLARHEHVSFKEGCDVVGLLPTSDKSGVAGVRVRARDEEAHEIGEAEDLAADFVVDASGRDSHAPEWLETLGYARPQETVINSFLGYASRYYQPPDDGSVDWKLLLLPRNPPTMKRGGAIYLLEGNRWIVTLSGGGKDYPPTDEAGFLDFARSMAHPALYDAIKNAKPLSPISGYRRTENRWRHYERLDRWPEGFIAAGDAVCAFNPVYGQGMSVAALGAETLDRLLREQPSSDLTGFARRFQKALGKLTATPWQLATGADFRYNETEGGHADHAARLRWRYGDAVRELAKDNRRVYQTFIEVAHLVKPPTALFQPAIVAQVLGRAASKQKAAVF
jgi:2-polyprenyl-6-methoxyphenol hydroxylase-like FAD-dependent oxidoreductase